MTTPPEYTVTELPAPDLDPWPTAINENGNVAGYMWDANAYGSAAVWFGGSLAVLQSISGDSFAYAIDDSDRVFGATPFYTAPPHAFYYPTPKPGPETFDLNPLLGGEQASVPLGVNSLGVLVGWTGSWFGPKKPFLFNLNNKAKAVLKPLPGFGFTSAYASAISDKDHVVGLCEGGGSPSHAFIFRGGKMTDLGTAIGVTGVTSADVVTGTKWFNGLLRAFRLDAGLIHPVFQALGPSPAPGFDQSEGLGINDAGVIVGASWKSGSPQNQYRAFVDFPASSVQAGWWDLHDVVPGGNAWHFEIATAINDKGQIVGHGTHHTRPAAFLLTPVPLNAPQDSIEERLIELIMLFGGVEAGGGGWGVLPNGKPVPIPPRQDFVAFWRRLPRPAREVLVGRAVQELASLLGERGQALERAASELVERAAREAPSRG